MSGTHTECRDEVVAILAEALLEMALELPTNIGQPLSKPLISLAEEALLCPENGIVESRPNRRCRR